MIEIDPQDRLLHSTAQKRPIGTVIAITSATIVIIGAGIFYWMFVSQNFSDVYKQLNITPLPITVELRPEIYRRLELLKREACDREAILPLTELMTEAGYPRESAKSLINFGERRCEHRK